MTETDARSGWYLVETPEAANQSGLIAIIPARLGTLDELHR